MSLTFININTLNMNKLIHLYLLLGVSFYIQGQNKLYDYDVEKRIKELGIELQAPTLKAGINIEFATKTGNLIYLSGATPNGKQFIGKVGKDLTIKQGYEAARSTAIKHLSYLKATIGDLNKVVKIVKVLGLVNATLDFTEHPKVINGYTDLMIAIFGERGKHSRSAMGIGSLPWNMACEIEAIVEVIE